MSIILTPGQQVLINKGIKWFKSWNNNNTDKKQYFVYSGAAGTGKTTVMKALLKEIGVNRGEYLAMAFVGKAVLQLRSNGIYAYTVHAGLYENIAFKNENGGISLIFRPKAKLPKEIRVLVIDEATMINDMMLETILAFGLPVIFCGDKNQLPPVMGISSIMEEKNIDHTLTDIMRQNEGDPIIQLSQMVLSDIPLMEYTYGNVNIIREIPFNKSLVSNYDQIICATNNLRYELNYKARRDILGFDTQSPQLGDRVICRKNNWGLLSNELPLTNGMAGTITDISNHNSYKNELTISFRPDLFEQYNYEGGFINIGVHKGHLESMTYNAAEKSAFVKSNLFEYAYAISIYLSQGSEYNRVLYIDQYIRDSDMRRKARYTAITRARKELTVVLAQDRSKERYVRR